MTDRQAARNFIMGFVPVGLDIVMLTISYLWPKGEAGNHQHGQSADLRDRDFRTEGRG